MLINEDEVKKFTIDDYLNKEFDCACEHKHKASIKKVIIDNSAINKLPEILEEFNYKNVFIVADNNTYKVAGEKVEAILSRNNNIVKKYIFNETHDLIPNEKAITRLLLELDKEIDVVIGVGSGTINDLSRIVSYKVNKPYFIVATAPSMDGYASNVSPLIINNLKITYSAVCPEAILCDLDILKNAPMIMIQAGIGDILGKYVCLCDWKLGNIINGEYYCNTIEHIMRNSIEKCVNSIEALKLRDEAAIKNLTEALILSGIAMSFSQNSRPASGAEHHMAHFWEMRFLLEGKQPILHGIKVGIGTIISAKLYETLFENEIDFNKAVISIQKFNKDAWFKYLKGIYKEAFEEVTKNIEKEYSDIETTQQTRIKNIQKHWSEITEFIKVKVPKADYIESILLKLDAPVNPNDVGIDKEVFLDSLMGAKDLRPRYTILQLINDLGLLKDISSKVFENIY